LCPEVRGTPQPRAPCVPCSFDSSTIKKHSPVRSTGHLSGTCKNSVQDFKSSSTSTWGCMQYLSAFTFEIFGSLKISQCPNWQHKSALLTSVSGELSAGSHDDIQAIRGLLSRAASILARHGFPAAFSSCFKGEKPPIYPLPKWKAPHEL